MAALLVDLKAAGSDHGGLASLGLATVIADRASDLGLLSRVDVQSRAWIDALTALSEIRDYPHAIVVFDAQARRLQDGGHRLSGLQAALIVRTAGNHQALEKRIQRLLNAYTNQNDSVLSTHERDGDTFYALRDSRLEDWLTIAWGRVGDHYAVAIGDGSFERCADAIRGRTATLAQDSWFDDAARKIECGKAYLGVLAKFDTVGTRTDKTLAYKVRRVQEALHLKDVAKGLWTLRLEGRVVSATGYVDRGGKSEVQRLTEERIAGASVDQVVPSEATRFANFDTEPATALGLFREAYLAARSPHSRERVFEYWRELEKTAGISIERQIFGNLGRGVLIHNYPRHALNLPLLCTIVIPIAPPVPVRDGAGARASSDLQSAGSNSPAPEVLRASNGQSSPSPSPAVDLRAAIDKLFTVWQSELREAAAPVSLRRDADGIWNLFLGLEGPALGLSDRWLVISFSPAAVRQNLEFLSKSSPDGAQRANANP